MKVQYLAIFAAISLLSVGIAAKPEAASTIISEVIGKKALANPCAAKGKTVGGPLAKQLRGKPVVVDIYASWCPACKNIAPTVSQLKQQYSGKVHFVVLDVSDRSTTAKSEAKAKELGLSQFFAANKTQTGSLTIVDPATGKILAQYRNNPDKVAYTKVLDSALAKK
jgi:thiol-disulfide isomerase/thioredoxin